MNQDKRSPNFLPHLESWTPSAEDKWVNQNAIRDAGFHTSRLIKYVFLQAFSSYVASKRNASIGDSISQPVWYCCDQTFWEPSSVHKHVARTHENEVQQLTEVTFQRLLSQLEVKKCERPLPRDHNQEAVEISSWLPDTSYLTVEELQK